MDRIIDLLDTKLAGGAFLLAALFITLFGIYSIRTSKRRTYNNAKAKVVNSRELEALTLEYNKANQTLDSYKLFAYIVAIFLAFLVYDIQAFSVLVLGFGALLIILKETVMSMIGSFFVMSTYDVGDDVRVGETLGEISSIKLLSTAIVGKEENGEYNGKLTYVPNYFFLQQRVEVQELKTTNYRLTSITLTQHPEFANEKFDALVSKTRAFLDELLPVRGVDEIGHFKSYAGRRYRLGLDYSKEGFAMMRLAFVAHPDDIGALREKIIGFLENNR